LAPYHHLHLALYQLIPQQQEHQLIPQQQEHQMQEIQPVRRWCHIGSAEPRVMMKSNRIATNERSSEVMVDPKSQFSFITIRIDTNMNVKP
jgi:hypothetical protein